MSTKEDFFKFRNQLTHPLVIEEKIQETPDAYSFRFKIPADLKPQYEYRAGQFVTLFLTVNGEHLKRSYSLCTSPHYDDEFQITVKQVEGGRGSNYLAGDVQAKDELYVTPPQGTFFQQLEKEKSAEYFLFAAGSGITPVFSIMKEVLATDPDAKVSLLFANRNHNFIIYKNELDKLVTRYADRLRVQHQLSRPTEDCEFKGRCDRQVVEQFLKAKKPGALKQAYICGPEGFMDSVIQGLKQTGFTDKEIRTESFQSIVAPNPESSEAENLDGVIIGDVTAPNSQPTSIKALINGEVVEIDVDPELSLLENLINAGKNPPYSCMDGACMACMAKVTSGKVIQEDPGILTDENIEDREALTCQAKAISKNVMIDYDNI